MFQEDDYRLVSAKAGDFVFVEDFWLNKQKDSYKNHHGMWQGPHPYLVLATGKGRDKLYAVPLTSSISTIADKMKGQMCREKCSRDMPSALFCTTVYPDGGRHNGVVLLNHAIVVPSYSKYCHVPRSFVGAYLTEIQPPSGRDYSTKDSLIWARDDYDVARGMPDYCPKSFDFPEAFREMLNYCSKLTARKAMITDPDAYDRWSDRELEKMYREFGNSR